MSGTKRFVEQRIIKNREQEAKDADLRRTLVEHNIYQGHGKSEVRVEEMRRARSQAAERRELFMDYNYAQEEKAKERRTRIAQFEENLADELGRQKAKNLREEMNKRRICDGSEELRALKERLHAAKVNKERAQQLLDMEVRKRHDRVVDHRMAEYMENERLDAQELDHKLVIEKNAQRERVKAINQQQIAMKEAQRQEAYEEYVKDKAQVQELVDQIEKEDRMEFEARETKRLEAKQQLLDFLKEQKLLQKAAEQAEKDENDRIQAYADAKRNREERLAAEKEEADRRKNDVLKEQLKVAEMASKEKEELEHLRSELHWEQLEAEQRRREELQMRKKLEDKEEMKNAYTVQMRMKAEKAEKFHVEEGKIRTQLLAKFAEDDRIELMNANKRRMKVEEHKREANRLVEERRKMYDDLREKEREHEMSLRAEEGKRQVIIEEERQKLLREHAIELRDFLPKSTLECREDYEMVFADRLLEKERGSGGYPMAA